MYRAGILSTEELARLHKDSTSAVMVIDDKLANQRSIDKLYSVKQAYAYLLTADTIHYRPNILRQCSLNEYLSPNLTYDARRTEPAKEEILDNYAKEMLKKKESIEGLVNRVVETKLASALKTQVTLENKNISAADFNKMFD